LEHITGGVAHDFNNLVILCIGGLRLLNKRLPGFPRTRVFLLNAQNAAQRSAGATFDVQSAADDTGLPMLVVRAPFNLVWQRLPGALEKVGMKVTDSTRS
ncbi:outer membrane protein assembly factor BamC, partial [Pseudomonas aeruginosa]|nr:outer membrane protein assembly factor BamC [Pseudomonas aeruginosa]